MDVQKTLAHVETLQKNLVRLGDKLPREEFLKIHPEFLATLEELGEIRYAVNGLLEDK